VGVSVQAPPFPACQPLFGGQVSIFTPALFRTCIRICTEKASSRARVSSKWTRCTGARPALSAQCPAQP
jgi:hypothetical protein